MSISCPSLPLNQYARISGKKINTPISHNDDGILLDDGKRPRTWNGGSKREGSAEIGCRRQPGGGETSGDDSPQNRLTALELEPKAQVDLDAKRLKFTNQYMCRRVEKIVQTQSNWGVWTVYSHEQFIYDGWNLVNDPFGGLVKTFGGPARAEAFDFYREGWAG